MSRLPLILIGGCPRRAPGVEVAVRRRSWISFETCRRTSSRRTSDSSRKRSVSEIKVGAMLWRPSVTVWTVTGPHCFSVFVVSGLAQTRRKVTRYQTKRCWDTLSRKGTKRISKGDGKRGRHGSNILVKSEGAPHGSTVSTARRADQPGPLPSEWQPHRYQGQRQAHVADLSPRCSGGHRRFGH